MNKKSLSIIALSDDNLKKSINVLANTAKHIPHKKIILLTSKVEIQISDNPEISIIKVEPITSAAQYNNFVIYKLHKFIDTSHVLIVQWDGQILNPKKWSEKFLNYDFVGAPFIPREYDFNYCRDKNYNFYVIGNGGFTIRSKRLLESAIKYDLKDDLSYTNNHEDGFYSVLHREFLESRNFTWADFSTAKEFCLETPLSLDDIFSFPLGFHGRKMLLISKFLFFMVFLNKLKTKLISLVK